MQSLLGCHIANIASYQAPKTKSHQKKHLTSSQYNEMHETALNSYPWLLGIERFDPSEYHPEDLKCIPEIGLSDGDDSDQEGDGGMCMTLTLTNVKDAINVCFVTVWDVDLCDSNGNILQSGWNATRHDVPDCENDGNTNRRKCTTFIVLCPPRTFVHLCYLAPNQLVSGNETNEENDQCTTSMSKVPITSWSQVEIESDIQPWSHHKNVNDEHSTLIHFPFCELKESTDEQVIADATTQDEQRPRYQCIQSENGQLTHFFHANYHAVDFACPVGTPLYSPVNGIIVNVHDGSNDESKEGSVEVSGIAATNLFHWNSIMIRADEASNDGTANDPLYIEYVHIQSKSCIVQAGDHVIKGQLLCKSGSVGFSPTPHLHLGAYRSGEDGAASVRVRFQCFGKDGESFFPVTGGWYDEFGSR
jgi:murein DD-endopeptidase MepM/ murein hydrolase activator NlpD